jgi:hypothetical protein
MTSAVYSEQILTQHAQDATIHTYPLKGGTHGNHAGTVLDSERGSRPLQGVRRNCQEVYQTEETASRSFWRSIAYHRYGLAGVHREAEQIRTRKLVLSVAHQWPIYFQQLSHRRCVRYLVVILPYGKKNGKG